MERNPAEETDESDQEEQGFVSRTARSLGTPWVRASRQLKVDIAPRLTPITLISWPVAGKASLKEVELRWRSVSRTSVSVEVREAKPTVAEVSLAPSTPPA